MKKRKGPTPKRRVYSSARPAPGSLEEFVEVVEERLDSCAALGCTRQAVRWYLRADVEDGRLVVYPTCFPHEGLAAEGCCPGDCEIPRAEHFARTPAAVTEQVIGALHHGWGVGFPMPEDWGRLDVMRPRLVRQ